MNADGRRWRFENRLVGGLVVVIVVLALAACAGVGFGAWDVAQPAGSLAVSLVDDQVRVDKSTLLAALGLEHTFGASDTSGIHREGAARIWVGTAAAMLTPTTLSYTASTTGKGRLYFATDQDALYYGDGTETWAVLIPKGRINTGTAAARSGVTAMAGRVYFATDTNQVSYGNAATPSVWTNLYPRSNVANSSYVWTTGPPTTTSSTFANISDTEGRLKETITTTGGAVRIDAMITGYSSSTYTVTYSLSVDDVNVSSATNGLGGSYATTRETVHLTWVTAALSAGDHVVRVLWRTSGGTGTVATDYEQTLVVTEQ